MARHRIYTTSVASVYPHYVAKVERKGRTKAEVDEVLRWLTGFSQEELETHLSERTDFETFFAVAPRLNPARLLIRGVVCGVRVEDVEAPTMRAIRCLDKLVDELARGKAMEKVLRKQPHVPTPTFRPVEDRDLPGLQALRRAAFAPIFESFRSMLGPEIASVTQARADEEQANLLASLAGPDSGWELYVAEVGGRIAGFVSVRCDREARMGEIGLNAVHPELAGRGVGTAMYRFAMERMREAGIAVATVSTGGDPSHAPARRAYEKAGFTVGIPSVWLCCHLGSGSR